MSKIGNNKMDRKEWIYQLKNCLRPILGKNKDWEKWINVAERNYKKSGELQEIGANLDDSPDEEQLGRDVNVALGSNAKNQEAREAQA